MIYYLYCNFLYKHSGVDFSRGARELLQQTVAADPLQRQFQQEAKQRLRKNDATVGVVHNYLNLGFVWICA